MKVGQAYVSEHLILKRQETGTEHVAMATSKCLSSGVFCRVKHACLWDFFSL